MVKYRSPLLAELAAQLRRGPKRHALRQLCGIEFLLSVLEPQNAYPYDFVVHTLTGYRAVSRDGNTATSARLLPYDALRADLIVLAEDLSTQAELPARCWPEDVYTVEQLARRFGVSTKTIFRWHRRGLVGWRLRFDDRRVRLAFPERCVRRFVAENVELVRRGRSFSQLSAQEREQIIAQARELVSNGERTVNAVARTIAARTGRAVETIRLILKTHDEAHPRMGLFNRCGLKVAVDDERLKIWEAYLDGASVGTLARHFERSVREIYRIVTEMRARDRQARPIEYVDSPEFHTPDAHRRILRDPAAAAPYADLPPGQRVPAGLPPYLAQLFRLPLLTPAGEVALFRKYNYLKYRADCLRQQLDPETASAKELDRIDALLEQAERVKSQIIQANLRLVVSIAKRHATPRRDFFEIVSDGNVSLMRAVEKFDYSRGYKFSTYASWAIIKNYARMIPAQRQHHDRYQTGRQEVLENVAGPMPEEYESDYLPALRGALDRMLQTLDERERAILRQRYGLDGSRRPLTLEQIGRRIGVSKERVRQLAARAMEKLRKDFEDEVERLLAV